MWLRDNVKESTKFYLQAVLAPAVLQTDTRMLHALFAYFAALKVYVYSKLVFGAVIVF